MIIQVSLQGFYFCIITFQLLQLTLSAPQDVINIVKTRGVFWRDTFEGSEELSSL